MRRVVITGATGFVGANLARRMLQQGHRVQLLVRKGHSHWRIDEIKRDVELVEVDLQDRERLDSVMQKLKPEWIFHLATYGAYSQQNDVHQIVQTNTVGTVNLLESAVKAGFEVFVNTGSSSEYGFKDHPPQENEYLEPNSHYAVSKAFATQYCRYVAQSKKMNLYTLRLYSVYGPYEEPTRFIPTIICYGCKGLLPPLVNPHVARDYIYVDDVVDAYVQVAENRQQELGAVYNVCSGKQTSIHDVVEIAKHILHIDVEPKWGTMPDRIWDTHVWVGNNSLLCKQLGWSPRCQLEDGFARTKAWLMENADRQALYRQKCFAGKGL